MRSNLSWSQRILTVGRIRLTAWAVAVACILSSTLFVELPSARGEDDERPVAPRLIPDNTLLYFRVIDSQELIEAYGLTLQDDNRISAP